MCPMVERILVLAVAFAFGASALAHAAEEPMSKQEIIDRLVGKTASYKTAWTLWEFNMKPDGEVLIQYGPASSRQTLRGKWTVEDGKYCFDQGSSPNCFAALKDGRRMWVIELSGSYKGHKHTVDIR